MVRLVSIWTSFTRPRSNEVLFLKVGTYRITYYGDAKRLFGAIQPFTGMSSSFTVIG